MITIKLIRKTAYGMLHPNAHAVGATGGLHADGHMSWWIRLRLQYHLRRQRSMRALRGAVAWDGDIEGSRRD
jgi:hypothetical protein